MFFIAKEGTYNMYARLTHCLSDTLPSILFRLL